jgi:hypothetical protein
MLLGQIKQVTRDTQLKPEDETTIKDVFKNILSNGDNYDLSEIEKWVNTITKSQSIVDRIMNIAHYQKIKHETNNRLKIMPDGCGCGGNC